jgi:hypothetical protein
MMRKKPTLAAAFGLSLGWMLAIGSAAAQQQGAAAHHQPSDSDVPASDSVRGDPTLGGQPSKSPRTKRSRTSRAQGNVDVILKTPNICSNCNQ